jgi:hypothetical protein
MRKMSFFLVVATTFILAMGVGGWTATTTGVNAAGKTANIDGFPGRTPIRGGHSVIPPVF